jgi:hypothetical protein
MDPELDEAIPPGPGLPGFVHVISGPGWVLVGLAALVAIARLDAFDLLDADRQWSVDDGFTLAAVLGSVVLVLVPVLLLHRRPAVWSEDRMLAVAAIVVAAQPVVGAVVGFVHSLVFAWLTASDDVEVASDLVQPVWMLLALPGWVLAFAAPLLIVWGFDRLDDRPPARFPRSRVVLVIGLLILLLVGALAGALLVAAAAGTEVSISWWSIASEIPPLALSAAWTWAALAALASGRAHRGRWWLLLLVSVILANLVPAAVASLGYYAAALSVESGPWWDATLAMWRLDGIAIAAGALALAGAFASVPRAAVAAPSMGEQDRREPA